MNAAYRAAQRLGSPFIGPEHILLGILDPDMAAAKVLRQIGADLEIVRPFLERRGMSDGPLMLGQIPFTSEAKTLIEAGAVVAYELKDVIKSSHLLAADLGNPEGVLPSVLPALGIDPVDLSRRVSTLLHGK